VAGLALERMGLRGSPEKWLFASVFAPLAAREERLR
jgi:hypothetical protein